MNCKLFLFCSEIFFKEIISKMKGESTKKKREDSKSESESDQQGDDTVIERLPEEGEQEMEASDAEESSGGSENEQNDQ